MLYFSNRRSGASLLLTAFNFALSVQASRFAQEVLASNPSHHTYNDRLGAVASENRVCSQIGINLLKDGGNAVDAVCPHSCSLLPLLTGGIAHWLGPLHWGYWQGPLYTPKRMKVLMTLR